MELHVFQDPEAVCRALADWLVNLAADAVRERGRFSIALSGGSTPKRLYELLATEDYRNRVDWQTWHVFWGDERGVPFDDDRNNARMAHEALFNRVPIPPKQLHILRTDVNPESAAGDYETLLRNFFAESPVTFDLVLLGLGDDGHTLSLFPGTEVVEEDVVWVRTVFLENQQQFRLTLTAPVVNRAACVAFLVTGGGKAGVVNAVVHGPEGFFPAQRIHPDNGNLHWFLDEAAANDLPKK